MSGGGNSQYGQYGTPGMSQDSFGSQASFGQGYAGNRFNGAYNAITGNSGMPPAGDNTGSNYSMPGSSSGNSPGFFPNADASSWNQMLMGLGQYGMPQSDPTQSTQPPGPPQPPQQLPNLATQEDYNRYNNLTPAVTPPPEMTYDHGVATGFANQPSPTGAAKPFMRPNPLASNPLAAPKANATFPGGDLYRTWLYGPTAGAFGGVSRPNNVPMNYGYFPDTQTWGLQPSGPIGR